MAQMAVFEQRLFEESERSHWYTYTPNEVAMFRSSTIWHVQRVQRDFSMTRDTVTHVRANENDIIGIENQLTREVSRGSQLAQRRETCSDSREYSRWARDRARLRLCSKSYTMSSSSTELKAKVVTQSKS
eukprot:scaffold1009_cov188-Alexandrium_tamarense.AAC.23